MKSLSGFGVVLLSIMMALSLGVAFAANETASMGKNVSEPVNLSASDMKEIQSIVKDLQNITAQLEDITKQLQNVTQLSSVTQAQSTTQLQNATSQLKNATEQLQGATNPFANVKGKGNKGHH
jgi:conjugal transfer/entry exclusion protein